MQGMESYGSYGGGCYREASDEANEVALHRHQAAEVAAVPRVGVATPQLQAPRPNIDLFTHYSIGLPILLRVFGYLDVRTLGQAVLVCRSWYSHNKERLTAGYDVEKNLDVCDYLSYVVQQQIKDIKIKDQAYLVAKKNKQKNAALFIEDPLVEYSPTDNTIDYVNATIDLLRQYLKNQAARQLQKKRMGLLKEREEQERRAFLNQLLCIMNNQLRDTIQALADILSGRTKWNANFEIFELSLRRYYEQLKVLFPANPSSNASASPSRKRASPTAIITDPQARLIWQMRVGSDSYYCDFERFYETVIEREFLQVTSPKMKQDLYYYFNYFLNFPRDNMVTTYKWEVLTRLFGPYHEFIENFSKYVLGSGFLGLINRHHAEEILEDHPQCVLMRFSRTYPTCLAFSFKKRDGKYDHYTNNPVWHGHPPFKGTRPKDETKNNIPIKEFLEKLFIKKGYQLLPHRVDGKSVAAMGTASKYAQIPDPYLETDNFETEDSICEDYNESWGTYKNADPSPSSSFSDNSGFGGSTYVMDGEKSPVATRASPLPSSSPIGRPLLPTIQLPDNYVADNVSSFVPPIGTFASTPPSTSPMWSPPPAARSPRTLSSSFDTSSYSDVFDYQRGAVSPRESPRSKSGHKGSQATSPAKIPSPKAPRKTSEPQPDSSCFYLDDHSVKEELARDSSLATKGAARKSKRAESFQANYLDDVVFVEEPSQVEHAAPITEYLVPTSSAPPSQQSAPVSIVVTPQRPNSYIDEETERVTAAATVQTSNEASTDNFILEALLGTGTGNSGGQQRVSEKNAESTFRDETRERKERAKQKREQAVREFEMNASMYERDGDIHFVDEEEVFRAGDNYTSTPASAPPPSWSSGFMSTVAQAEKIWNQKSQQSTKGSYAPNDDDSILAAILDRGRDDGGIIANKNKELKQTAEEEEQRLEKQKREERRREKEEKRKRKEERRRKKEQARRQAQEQFEQAASDYGADLDASKESGVCSDSAEDDSIPMSGKPSTTDSSALNEYFLDVHKPDVKIETQRADEREKTWAEEEDQALMSAILGSTATEERRTPERAKQPLQASGYAVSFDDEALSTDSEYEEKLASTQPRQSGNELRAETTTSAQEERVKAQERREQEERAQAEEKRLADARQKEGFVLTYSELSRKDKSMLPRYVDKSKLESYLSEDEFNMVFGCTRAVFYTYKLWRQQQLKRNANLF